MPAKKSEYNWAPTPLVQTPFLASKVGAFIRAKAEKERLRKRKPVTDFFKGVYTELDVRWPTYESEEEAEAAERTRLLAEKADAATQEEASTGVDGDSVPAGSSSREKKDKEDVDDEEPEAREAPPADWDVRVWQEARHKKVYHWFYNKEAKLKKDNGRIEVVVASVQRKALCDWQVFSKDFYTEMVKPQVDEEVARLVKAREPVPLVSLRQGMTIKAWEAADEETKEKVYARMEALAEGRKRADAAIGDAMTPLEEGAQRTPEEYHQFLEILPDLLDGFFNVVAAKSGWSFTLLAGGPDPSKEGGGIRTMSYHHGVTSQDQTFRQFLPPGHFAEMFMKPFSGFLHMLYPKEVRQARELAAHGSSATDLLYALNPGLVDEDLSEDQIEGNMVASGGRGGAACTGAPAKAVGEGGDDPSLDSTPGITTGGLSGGNDGRVAVEPSKEDREKTRKTGGAKRAAARGKGKAAVVGNTQQVVDEGGSKDVSSSSASGEIGSGARQMNEVTGGVGSSSAPSMGAGGYPGMPGCEDAPNWFGDFAGNLSPDGAVDDGDPLGVGRLLPPADMVFGDSAPYPAAITYPHPGAPYDPSSSLPPQGSLSALLYDFGAIDLQSSTGAHCALEAGRSAVGSPGVAAVAGAASGSVDGAVLDGTSSGSVDGAVLAGTSSGSVDGAVLAGTSSAEADLLDVTGSSSWQNNAGDRVAGVGVGSASTLPVSATLATGAAANVEKRPWDGDESTHEGSGREKRVRRLNSRQETPPWVTSGQAYLTMEDLGVDWQGLVQVWVTFETRNAILDTGSVRLPKPSARPKKLSQWLTKKKFQDVLAKEEVAGFAKQWLVWWNAIQPAWRKNEEEWGLPHPIGAGGRDLSSLKKPGFCGLFSVLVGLRWWSGVVDTPVPWKDAVADVRQCLEALGGR
ncbi:hypothetical protein CC1G_13019 [Coprinopsis cinerea okayama7|uniref:Uncharacterized protein n=1 Tax=Coprinopsis cinerea (strain Okayama-7 / 130 / ATCC MYA-4618 / FGSC 9003) TaxID=240176 RepID=A8N417_COPC7|nr:hypothetical protein CC1G_13019 [Coprinopsis cinerea okayama7\|eukprot:XP_001829612.1 hypothetical protein CC1G_13019 [Coprinopsis cinerea okayama7\